MARWPRSPGARTSLSSLTKSETSLGIPTDPGGKNAGWRKNTPCWPSVILGRCDQAMSSLVGKTKVALVRRGPRSAHSTERVAMAHSGSCSLIPPCRGKVSIAVQSRYNDGIPTDEILTAVRNQVRRDDVKPFTDVVSVRPIINIPYTIDVETFVLPGPDPAKVKADIVAAELAMAEERRKPSRDVPRSAVSAAAFVPVADKVNVYKPAQDIARGNGEVAFLTATPVVKVTEYAG